MPASAAPATLVSGRVYIGRRRGQDAPERPDDIDRFDSHPAPSGAGVKQTRAHDLSYRNPAKDSNQSAFARARIGIYWLRRRV